jgi:hypothetical protein
MNFRQIFPHGSPGNAVGEGSDTHSENEAAPSMLSLLLQARFKKNP